MGATSIGCLNFRDISSKRYWDIKTFSWFLSPFYYRPAAYGKRRIFHAIHNGGIQ